MKKHPLPGKKCWDKRCRVCEANEKLLRRALNQMESTSEMECTQ